jgi:hypothetical protein
MNQAVVSKIQVEEYETKLRFLLRNSVLAMPKALLCELRLDSEVDQIIPAKFK